MPAPSGSPNTKWADGLRGVASLLVVTAHISRSLAPYLTSPTLGPDSPPLIFQLPLLRTLLMGRASVAVFAIISGFVNSLKPTRQSRSSDPSGALHSIARSAFRRTGRFVFPVMIATLISWLICQFGAYNFSRTVESQWIRDTSPPPSSSFAAAFADLFSNLISTWTNGGNIYDPIQWTMAYLLRGSMLVYYALFATSFVQPRWRVAVYAVMEAYYWCMGDAVIGINIFAGMIMAELVCSQEVQEYVERRPISTAVLSSMSIFLGLLCCSYPEENPEWADWSAAMMEMGTYFFPEGSEFARFYPGVGAQLICYGVMFNATARKIFSSSLTCFLGKVSFGVYLTHAPLIRTVLTWLLFGFSTRPPWPGNDKEGHPLPQPWTPMGSPWVAVFAIPLWYLLLYKCASLWVAHVDPLCAAISTWIEEKIWRIEGEGAEKGGMLA